MGQKADQCAGCGLIRGGPGRSDRNLLVGKKALPFPKDKLFLTIVPGPTSRWFCSLDYLIKLLFAPQP